MKTHWARAGRAAAIALALFGVTVARFEPERAVADVIVAQSPATLHARSENMVRARVADVRSAWNVDRSFIFTYVALEVLDYYKGAGPTRLEVRVPGGKVGTYGIFAESMPAFQVGEEVVVFLRRWGDGALKVVGYEQGLSRIEPSPQGPVLRGGRLNKRLLPDVEREARVGILPARP